MHPPPLLKLSALVPGSAVFFFFDASRQLATLGWSRRAQERSCCINSLRLIKSGAAEMKRSGVIGDISGRIESQKQPISVWRKKKYERDPEFCLFCTAVQTCCAGASPTSSATRSAQLTPLTNLGTRVSCGDTEDREQESDEHAEGENYLQLLCCCCCWNIFNLRPDVDLTAAADPP